MGFNPTGTLISTPTLVGSKHLTWSLPFPEPMTLEQEGALLNWHCLGLNKQCSHQNGFHNNTNGKEEEGTPLQHTHSQLSGEKKRLRC